MEQITFIYTTKPEETWAFYSDVLGFEMVFEKAGCRIFQATHSSYLGVCHRPERPSEAGGVCISFVAHEVNGWYRRLTAAGVPTDGPPRESEALGIYNFFAYDPEGHAIEFQRFTDPAWPGARETI